MRHPPEELDPENRFADSSIDRRTFVRLSAATAGALALPGNATADVADEKMSAEYEYILNHTPADSQVETLVTFSDDLGPETFAAMIDGETVTTTDPEPAAYGELSTSQAELTAALPTAETLSHSPGANPFWRLGYYPLGVFPDPTRSTDYIDYEEMIAGMEHLESEHGDRMDFYSIGESPGFQNYISDREDPKDVWVVELTNDIADEASYQEKQKVLFSLSIHGLEREGVEAGTRFIENLLDGRETETEALLDDLVLVFVYSNPDGWVAKHPQYESTGDAPVVPVYKRGNAMVQDTNRQYPITGWINPAHFPAEPEGSNYRDDEPGVDMDVPDAIREHVPDTLAIVEHFRDYENMDYGADMHGAAGVPEFVLGLISQDQFDHRQLHELYQMNLAVDEVLEDALTTWNTLADGQQAITGGDDPTGVLPEQAFDYSAIWDTLGYTDSGFMGDWFSHPTALGSLGMTAMDFEMNLSGGFAYNPELVRMQVLGYVTAIRTMAQFAVRNSDTPNTEDEFEATVETGGLSTAYVTTDALTRSSDQIVDTDGETNKIDRDTEAVALQSSATLTSTTVPEDAHTLSVFVEPDATGFVRATLRSPDGESIRSYDPAAAERLRDGTASWSVRDPAAGDWTIELAPATSAGGDSVVADVLEPADTASVTVATLQSTTETPHPEEALGYGQRDYKASPFIFFDKSHIPETDDLRTNDVHRDYDDVTDAAIDPLTVQDVTAGLHHEYDNLVVIHDEVSDDTAYLDALESYVDSGGNLVLTDSGVHLLGALETDLSNGIIADNVQTDDSFYIAHLGEKTSNHPLLDGTRPIQQALWKVAPLGYSISNEAPMTLVDQQAFEESGGEVAATTDGQVAAGTLLPSGAEGTVRDIVASDDGSIQVISSLLPPAKQTNLHPFGVLDYALSFLGHTMLTNSLGYVQHRFVSGEEVATFGGNAEFGADDPGVDFSANGSRADDGSVFTGGQTNTVDITVEGLTHDAVIADHFPEGWTVDTEYFDVTGVDEENNVVELGTVSADDVSNGTVTLTYAIEAPDGLAETNTYDFGPAEAIALIDGQEETDTFAGTDTNLSLGPSTNIE